MDDHEIDEQLEYARRLRERLTLRRQELENILEVFKTRQNLIMDEIARARMILQKNMGEHSLRQELEPNSDDKDNVFKRGDKKLGGGGFADRRDEILSHREIAADERDRIADLRDLAADHRDVLQNEREKQLQEREERVNEHNYSDKVSKRFFNRTDKYKGHGDYRSSGS